MATLRELVDADVRIIGLVQLAESVLELRGSRGGRRIIYLSGADTEALPAIAHFKKLVDVATRDVPAAHRGKVARFFQRVFIDAARAPHGSLIAVIPKDASPRAVFADGIVLERPLRISELTMAHETADRREPFAVGEVVPLHWPFAISTRHQSPHPGSLASPRSTCVDR